MTTPDDADFREILEPLCETLESGILVVGHGQRIVVCSLAMCVMLGKSPKDFVGMSTADFTALVLSLVDDPPKLLTDRGLFPVANAVLCEEFELGRPSRSVVRWIARKVRCRAYALVAVATDITADVDLTHAYERMALTDPLTRLANRQGVERQVKQELLRLRRYETPVSFVLFDLDHFKVINDTHGHVMGDEVLRRVSKVIAETVRETDWVARWGGEEFLVVLPETSRLGALLCAERVRLKVAGLGDELGFSVTISGGVYEPGPGESMSAVLSGTDARLYQAKRDGRNRVC